ncbi:MAG: S1/P1 nuclease [Pseudomonadales bacterium]
MKRALLLAGLPLVSVLAVEANAWGASGHRAVARLADKYLSQEARTGINEIIGSENQLWELSTWPDEIRSNPNSWRHTFPWHYISIDDHEDIYGEFPRSDRGDILSGIDAMAIKINDPSLSMEERWEALAFYIHFVGDIHQPLHVGNRSDRGGNALRVDWFGQRSNLHSVWDSKIIDHWGLSFTELVEALDEDITLADTNSAHVEPIVWAAESKVLRNQCYERLESDDGEYPDLGYEYAYYNGDLVRDRLRLASYRLAYQLNNIFAAE